MDIEKYTSGKLYHIFEWSFKLIIWNLLTLLIICSAAAIPFISFFNLQDRYAISNVEVVNNNNIDEVVVTQSNGVKTNLGNKKIYGEITKILEDTNKIYLYITLSEVTYEIKINNSNNIRNIESAEFINEELIIKTYLGEHNLGNIYNGELDLDNCKLDGYQNVIIGYQNGVFINYGQRVETAGILSGALVIIGLILALFAFIPCYVTIFSMIKIFAEDGSAQTLMLFFNRLWDNFKSLYKLELFIVPFISLMSYGIYSYYFIINSLEQPNFFLSMSYNVILIALICMALFILNLPMTLGYFRMKSMTIFKFTFSMAFRNILYSFLYVGLLIMPLLLCLLNNFFLPIWFLIGLSLPLLLMYFISSKKYHKIVYDFNSYKENDDIYDFKGEDK